MKDFLSAIHGLHEDTRKLLAGITIAVVGLGFVGVWTSFISSRLVALGPPARENAAVGSTVPVARRLSPSELAQERREPPSPAAGIAASVSDAGNFFARGKTAETGKTSGGLGGFFASVGQGLAAVAEAIYMKLAPWAPPYL